MAKLPTINTILHKFMLEFLSFAEVSALYERIFWLCVAEIDLNEKYLTDEINEFFHDGIIIADLDYVSLRTEFDKLAQISKDNGKYEESKNCYNVARLMESLVLFHNATNNDEISDAIYVAIMTSDNPQATAKKAEFLLPAT